MECTNDQGDPVSAGMYIYTIESESFYHQENDITQIELILILFN
ncbi:MAG: hypothetical protein CM15mP87_10040 [Candidatus Neomarinimicrobiota bacterium]|nr:MAG: hypothetical protein CM15mP87_10040 [Candidatus Neomarinimicrobiota bacterium]